MHGTRSGYHRHLREETPPCDDCRRANREHQRTLRLKVNPNLSRTAHRVLKERAADEGLSTDEYVWKAIEAYDLLG